MNHHHIRQPKKYHTGTDDGLEPLKSLDVNAAADFDELASAMKSTAFGGRSLGEAVDVLHNMVTDPDVFVVGTFSGAMTPAKMGLLIVEMIDRGMLNAVVSTGALMTHGMVEGFGMNHFKYKPGMNDELLYERGYDRIYDVLELEKNLDDLELLVDEVLATYEPGSYLSSQGLNRRMGQYLSKHLKHGDRAILKSAYEKNVPVYIPALSDSEYGLDLALYNRKLQSEGKSPLVYTPMDDLEHISDQFLKAKKVAIFTIGGGVPRNWAQQIAPFLQLLLQRLPSKTLSGYPKEAYTKRYQYAVRICPEPVHWGGLSGCTYSEGVSWGKFMPESEGGKFAEVLSDATIAWPIVLKAVIQRIEKAEAGKDKIKKR